MRTTFECWPCFLAQALRGAKEAGLDQEQTRTLLVEVGGGLADLHPSAPPPDFARHFYARIAELSGREDPYAATKREHTRAAIAVLDELRRRVREAADELDAALRVAAAGNRLDLGALADPGRVEDVLAGALSAPTPVWEVERFRGELARAGRVLVLGDNAGETVFDRLMLESLGRLRPEAELAYAVRGGPVINDATVEDALEAGVDQAARLLSTGAAVPGVLLAECSADFVKAFHAADLVLAKGQGNYETLSEPAPRPLWYLLTVKCHQVSEHLGAPTGSSILLPSHP